MLEKKYNISQKPDAIFFDWDGTLADTYSFLNNGHIHVQKSLGMNPFVADEYRAYFGKPHQILYPQIYGELHKEAKALFEIYVSQNRGTIPALPGAKSLLDTLQKHNIKMGVVSNKQKRFINDEIENFGWQKFFSSVVGAGEAEKDKPSAAPLYLAIERAGLDRNSHTIWYVGDTEVDLKCAKDAGFPSIFIKGDEETERLIEEYNPLIASDDCISLNTSLNQFLIAI